MKYILLILVIVFTVGMAKVPPPVCKYDPIFNSEVTNSIKNKCTEDCVGRNAITVDCVGDCTSFTKWGIKYGYDK